MSEGRITSLRADIRRIAPILEDPDQPPHTIALAGRRIAEAQLQLQQLTGEEPSITLDEVERYEAAVMAANQRRLTGQIPQYSHQANVSGEFQRRAPVRETELVRDPVDHAIQSRRRLHANMAAAPVQRLGGGMPDNGPIPYASPAYNLNGNGPIYQSRPTHLSSKEYRSEERRVGKECSS